MRPAAARPRPSAAGRRAWPLPVSGLLALGAALAAVLGPGAARPAPGPPASPFIGVVYGYADAMLAHGRDRYGPKETGLFLSALDRGTLAPLAARPASPAGIDATG